MRVFWVVKYRGLNEMSIEDSIAEHCNTHETACNECGENMYIELGSTTLKCASDECGNEIELVE